MAGRSQKTVPTPSANFTGKVRKVSTPAQNQAPGRITDGKGGATPQSRGTGKGKSGC